MIRIRSLLVGIVALVGVVGALTWPDKSDSYVFKGKLWPGGVVRYFNAAGDQSWAVARAVEAWNRSGAGVRFVGVPRASAQLVIEHFGHRRCVGHALATVGFVRRARIQLPRLDERSAVCNRFASASMVAHELGHVLGLRHEERGCALMNSRGFWHGPERCARPERWQWRCGLLEYDDVRGVARVYGGRAVRRPTRLCSAYVAIAPPSRFAAWYWPEQVGVGLRFVRPRLPAMPLFMRGQPRSPGGYAFASARGRCPTEPGSARRIRWSVSPGAQTRIVDRAPAAGRYCYAVWALDPLGRPSEQPALAWVAVPT